MTDEPQRRRWARVVLRVAVALLLIIHGVARASLGIVDDFGGFLASLGLPFGTAVAWLLTVVEIAGGLALAAGFLVLPLCVWFAVELATGIALVHAPNGWFVVGAGRNGVEFSVLLIVCLVVITLEHPGRRRTSP
ncbi:MAG TPA: DoxX family protein [Thermoanaerobaculia bacterium]|nr:DoxX family protein [Thermoanaerobaculia bacterium]